jgi:hypothetical protein
MTAFAAGVIVSAAWMSEPLFAAESAARVSLLPAGTRASIVIEFDGEAPMATTVQTSSNDSVAVKIGPIRGGVVNQLLKAGESSPLVNQVRVLRGSEDATGTVMSLQIVTKAPVTGTVRRAKNRIYVDLEPLASERAPAAVVTPARPEPAALVATTGRSSPGQGPAATKEPIPKPSAGPQPAPSAVPSLPPVSKAGSTSTNAAGRPTVPDRSGPGNDGSSVVPPAPLLQPVPPPPAAVVPADATSQFIPEEIERTAQGLVSPPDVKALERLKAEVMARRSSPASQGQAAPELDALMARLDQFLIEAQRNQLSADASLLRNAPARRTEAAAGDFAKGIRPLLPTLESVNNALASWSGGALPPANLHGTVSSLVPQLQRLNAPAELAPAHGRLCSALGALSALWARAAVEPVPEGAERTVIDGAGEAVSEFLRLHRTFESARPR